MECYDHMGQDPDKCGYCELISDHEAKIDRLTAELAQARAELMKGATLKAAKKALLEWKDLENKLHYDFQVQADKIHTMAEKLAEVIAVLIGDEVESEAEVTGAIQPDPGPTALAEMLDAETRACAKAAEDTGTCLLPSGHFLSERCRDAILARIDQRKEAGK